jgi:ribokinase
VFAADGVELCAAPRDGRQNRALTVADPSGERTIFVIGRNEHPTLDDPLPWDELARFDGVFFTGDDPRTLVAARRARVLLVTARRFASLVASGVEADVLIGSAHDPAEAVDVSQLRAPPRLVIHTDGARGGTWRARDGSDGRWASAPPPGPVADTYGAGDVFMAALTLGLARREALADALAFSACAAAGQLTRRGGAPPAR